MTYESVAEEISKMASRTEADAILQKRKCFSCCIISIFVLVSTMIEMAVTLYFIITVHEPKVLAGTLRNILLVSIVVTIVPTLILAFIKRKCYLIGRRIAALKWLLARSPEQQERLVKLIREREEK